MIYIVANANCVSGGPELLHQLCFHLNNMKIEAKMVYYGKLKFPTTQIDDKLIQAYSRYHCEKVERIEDKEENTVVLPEGALWFLPKFKKSKIIIWWLSVDNYYKSMNTKYAKLYAPFGMRQNKYNPFRNSYIHCVQSEYAREFLLLHGIQEEKIYSLSDYLSSEFISESCDEDRYVKENIVLYNPKKGMEFTKKIMDYTPNIKYVPLIGLSHNEMAEMMKKSKVYIDFGNHPGKDRIPREAAISGCCIITNLEGAAGNDKDVNIPHEYKIEMKDENLGTIKKCIEYCLREYETAKKDFAAYREEIKEEESKFVSEIKTITKIMQFK